MTGMTPEGLKTLNLELEDGGRLPDPNSAQLELVYGNTVITNFYEKHQEEDIGIRENFLI